MEHGKEHPFRDCFPPGTKLTQGGEEHAATLLQQNHAMERSVTAMHVADPHNAIVRGLAWSANAAPPDL